MFVESKKGGDVFSSFQQLVKLTILGQLPKFEVGLVYLWILVFFWRKMFLKWFEEDLWCFLPTIWFSLYNTFSYVNSKLQPFQFSLSLNSPHHHQSYFWKWNFELILNAIKVTNTSDFLSIALIMHLFPKSFPSIVGWHAKMSPQKRMVARLFGKIDSKSITELGESSTMSQCINNKM